MAANIRATSAASPTVQGRPKELCDYEVMQVSRVRLNPYVRLLQAALVEAGVACTTVERLTPRALPDRLGPNVLLHLHWLELQYQAPTWARSLRRLVGFEAALTRARNKGARLVYTIHNLSPHEEQHRLLSAIASRMVLAQADALHVHDKTAATRVAQLTGSDAKVHIIPHGSYIGAYPNSCTREEARSRLNLPQDAFVYLYLGQIRPYKGIDDLINAFTNLPAGNQRLLLAGHLHDTDYARQLVAATANSDTIQTHFGYVDDADVQFYMNASDICVLPYRDVTTSGAAILAFSFGKPIIAPSIGTFPELAQDGRGVTYDATKADDLSSALASVHTGKLTVSGQQALLWAEDHCWSHLVPSYVSMYQFALEHGRPAGDGKPDGHKP